jgi:hypothetical protein
VFNIPHTREGSGNIGRASGNSGKQQSGAQHPDFETRQKINKGNFPESIYTCSGPDKKKRRNFLYVLMPL